MVLVEHELPSSLQLDLSHPVWARRITVLIGSPLCQADLTRARWGHHSLYAVVDWVASGLHPFLGSLHGLLSVSLKFL